MARTIDERIVQMTFNNQEFEERAKTTISTLGKLKSTTDAISNGEWLTNLGKSIANSGLQTLTVTTSKISEGFSALEQIAVGALRNIGAQAEATGRKLLKDLTTANITAGWGKYVDLTGSVQTLINSTGKGVDEIDGYLERLMWYSDETSFGFTDMTKALGTMVSSGGDINKLIPMLMGVGNAVAYAGKGASEFTRVIYNLNQSYSSGFLNTMDWKSIELASADSKMLKEQLLAAAVEVGTINKESAKLENFRDLLSDKVFTRDVMEKAFGRFADFTLEVEKAVAAGTYETASEAMEALAGNFEGFQESAFVAAQSAKSFKEAIEATQDAVSSGWMQSFKLIFGNYEESKALWTDVTGSLWDWFASGAESRNKVLKEWKSIWTNAYEAKQAYENLDPAKTKNLDFSDGFYEDIDDSMTQIQSLWRAFSQVIDDIRNSISTAWNNVFDIPTISETAKILFNAVETIRKGLLNLHNQFKVLKDDAGVIGPFQPALEGIFTVLKALVTVGREFVNSFIKPLGERFKPIFKDILDIINNIGNGLKNFGDGIINDLTPMQKIFQGLLDILDPIITAFEGIVKWVKELTSQNSEISVFSGLFQTIGNIFESLGKFVKGSGSIISQVLKLLGEVGKSLQGIIGNLLSSHGSDVSAIAEGGFLAYLGVGLAKVVGKLKKIDLKEVLSNIFGLFKDGGKGFINTIENTFSTLTDSLQKFSEAIKVKLLDTIANSLIKLAAALLIISLVDSSKIADSLGSLTAVMVGMFAALDLLNRMKVDKSINDAAKAFSKISTGILILSISLKMLSGIEPERISSSLTLLGVSLGGVLAFILVINKALKNTGDITKLVALGQVFKQMAFGLIEISLALKILSTIQPEQVASSLLLLGGALVELMGFFVLTGKFLKDDYGIKLQSMGKALTNMSVGLIALSVALKIMSTITGQGMDVALVGLFGSLAMIAGFAIALDKLSSGASFIAVAAGLLIMSVALGALSAVIYALGRTKPEIIGQGLDALAQALLVIGGLGAILGLVSPLLLLASAALLTFGLALASVADGIMKFAAAYTLFQALGSNFAQSILNVFEQAIVVVVGLIPTFIGGIIEGLLVTITIIKDKILEIIRLIFDIVVEGFMLLIHPIIELIKQVIIEVIGALDEIFPHLIDLFFNIINYMIQALNENLPSLVDGLFDFLVTAVNSIAETIRTSGPELGQAIGNLASALIESIVGGIFGFIESFVTNLWDAGKELLSGIIDYFSGNDAKKRSNTAGESTVDNYQTGIEQKKPTLHKAVDTIGKDTTDTLDRKDDAKTSGDFTIQGFIDAAKSPDNLARVYNAFKAVGKMATRGLNAGAEVNSPSKAAMRTGGYIVEGLVIGLKDNIDDVFTTGKNVGSMMLDAIAMASDKANQILNDDLNPVITPVLDLSNIYNGAGTIADMLNGNSSYNSAMAIGQSVFGNNQNGVNSNPTEINMYNTFEINGVENMDNAQADRFANMLYDKINTLLGNEI